MAVVTNIAAHNSSSTFQVQEPESTIPVSSFWISSTQLNYIQSSKVAHKSLPAGTIPQVWN